MDAQASFGAGRLARPGSATRAAPRRLPLRGASVAAILASTAVAAPVLALLSIALQGFSYGVANNIFQAPIALGMPSWPQFRGDWFYQSLGSYCSMIWPALAALGPGLDGPSTFLVLHIVTRIATFAALLALLARLGLGATDRWLAGLVLATSALLAQSTSVGHQALFDSYFNQDAVAWLFILLGWVLVMAGRHGAAVALTGACFAASAFMAVWSAIALSVAGVADVVAAGRGARLTRLHGIALKGAVGGAVALIVAGPAIVWAARTAIDRPHPPFDYAGYLWSYYPNHFFIAASTAPQIFSLGGVTLAGAVALVRLGKVARPLLWLFAGYAAVFLVGVALPSLTHARMLLNLHLLRVDGCLQAMAAIACVAVAIGDLRRRGLVVRAAGALALFEVMRGANAMPMLALAVLAPVVFRRAASEPVAGRPWTLAAPLAAIAVAFAGGVSEAAAQFDGPHQSLAAEARAGAWLKANTPVMSKVLARPELQHGLGQLQLYSERQVWIDWKRGAVAMWRPDLYPIWRQRMAEVASLATVDQAADYACHHDIRYLVEASAGLGPGTPGRIVRRDDYLTIIDLAGACPAPAVRGAA